MENGLQPINQLRFSEHHSLSLKFSREFHFLKIMLKNGAWMNVRPSLGWWWANDYVLLVSRLITLGQVFHRELTMDLLFDLIDMLGWTEKKAVSYLANDPVSTVQSSAPFVRFQGS